MVGILTKSERGEHVHLVLLFVMLPESGVVGVGTVNRSFVWLEVTASVDWSENGRPRFQWAHTTRYIGHLN